MTDISRRFAAVGMTAIALASVGCGMLTVPDGTTATSAISLGKNLVDSLGQSGTKQEREYNIGAMRVYEAIYLQRPSALGTGNSFNTYCRHLGGEYRSGLCSYDAEQAAHFYVEEILTGVGGVGERSEYSMKVIEATRAPGTDVLDVAIKRGYMTLQESARRKAQQEEKDARRKQNARDTTSAEIDRRLAASASTRQLVLQKGTTICRIAGSDCTSPGACATEDVNAATGRIKYSLHGEPRNWTDAADWFAC